MSVRMRFVHSVYCLFNFLILYTALCTHVHVYKIFANEGVVLCTRNVIKWDGPSAD